MEKYLKPKQYYVDLYDRHTVDQCRRSEQAWNKSDTKPPVGKKMTKRQTEAIKNFAEEWTMHFKAGERYLNKEKTIREWMEDDERKDSLYESAQAPEDIRCLTCRNRVVPTFKEMWYEIDKPDRVLFMYDCPNKCMPRRAFFSDGEEWRIKPHLCVRCNTPLNQEAKDDGKKLVTTRTCPKCKYFETDKIVWSLKKEEDVDENFASDRDRFCLSDEDGRKFQDEKWNLERMGKFMEEWKEKEKVRAEKLKENPKGFHLEGAGYTCFICGDSTPNGDNWYDEWGIKCLICQKAIDNKEIPASLAKFKDTWYTKHDFESYFNIKSATVSKWVRQGILKARTVSHYGGGVHIQLFLLKDNKDFIPPKKLVESRSVRETKDGKDWHTSAKWYKFVDPYEHLKGYGIMNYLQFIPDKESNEKSDEKH